MTQTWRPVVRLTSPPIHPSRPSILISPSLTLYCRRHSVQNCVGRFSKSASFSISAASSFFCSSRWVSRILPSSARIFSITRRMAAMCSRPSWCLRKSANVAQRAWQCGHLVTSCLPAGKLGRGCGRDGGTAVSRAGRCTYVKRAR